MKMTPKIFFAGSILVWAASVSIMVIMPLFTMYDEPSDTWRQAKDIENEGLKLYVSNGCSYCHSLYIRNQDWDIGAERIAKAGDYYNKYPAILGSERTGPDLSQEGGEHTDDWQFAHFVNPRYTRPVSLMPSWEFLGKDKIDKLTAYVQSLGGKDADARVARQDYWNKANIKAYETDQDKNIEWLHSKVPEVWRNMPNPYPAYTADVLRGENIYQKFCLGCHGPVGDGNGPASKYMKPKPVNFTTLNRHLAKEQYIGGILYYQIMNGITGSSMPYFKKELESEKIWDLANYITVEFMGYSDSDTEPKGIDASYE